MPTVMFQQGRPKNASPSLRVDNCLAGSRLVMERAQVEFFGWNCQVKGFASRINESERNVHCGGVDIRAWHPISTQRAMRKDVRRN